ncbi:MarR family transcriptional regulator [Spiractinospora alimapuensis]|uniref:MarR family winged helix-turn-helix transcriptional regulator n=1 Tax=Spiractinospora alimapuensis TaxID=2820884 RepID=UPI001F23568F|nr:MarR family transcriptional regulator [Spiractinospora alimapuensis]QVQ50150.1 MarR family transcriptional regulator [Spiractinospora alimapuensis]
MTVDPSTPSGPDYLSFVNYAVEEATTRLPGVDPVSMRLGLTLHRLTSTLVYDWESTVHRPRGWSWSGFRLLFVLWLAGPLEAKRTADLSGMSRAAVSAVANTLERDGLVTRRQSDQDRRSVLMDLTPVGKESLALAYAEHNRREQAWANALTSTEQQQLIVLLEKVAASRTVVGARRRV